MKFNEWLTQNHGEFNELGMKVREEEGLVENQLQMWVTKLMGLLQGLPPQRKHELLERVIISIEEDMKQI